MHNFSSTSLRERNHIINEHRKVVLEMRRIEKDIEQLLKVNDPYWKNLEQERNKLYVQIEPLIEKYWNWIAPVVLSRCPFCEQDLLRLFDPVDLNGFWWMDRTQRPRPEPKCCEHFCLLLGALNTNGLPLTETLFECRPGPQAPYVIRRILEMPTMTAVVSSIKMHCGYSVYPIAYFSKIPPKERALTQSWAQKQYNITLKNGRSGWDITDDVYDHGLAFWIGQGKLRWVFEGTMSEPGALADAFPFPSHN